MAPQLVLTREDPLSPNWQLTAALAVSKTILSVKLRRMKPPIEMGLVTVQLK